MMIVSIVIPDTGLRAVVAMALAATEVKKNENTSVSATPTASVETEIPGSREKNAAIATVATTTPSRMVTTGMSRSVRSNTSAPSPFRNALSAIENDPATTRSDLMMPKMPAVAIAPTPMNRT